MHIKVDFVGIFFGMTSPNFINSLLFYSLFQKYVIGNLEVTDFDSLSEQKNRSL